MVFEEHPLPLFSSFASFLAQMALWGVEERVEEEESRVGSGATFGFPLSSPSASSSTPRSDNEGAPLSAAAVLNDTKEEEEEGVKVLPNPTPSPPLLETAPRPGRERAWRAER